MGRPQRVPTVSGVARAGPGPRALADGPRGDDHRVDPDERAIADRGPCLVSAVEVGGDRAGADVHARADLGVAEIAHVVLLGTRAETGVLELGVVADLGTAPDDAARPHVAVRPDRGVILDRRRFDDRRPDTAIPPDRTIDHLAAGPDDRALPDRRRAVQDDVRLERDVCGKRDVPVEVDRRGIAHRHAVAHVLLVASNAQVPLGGGELGSIVDAVESAVVLEGDRGHESAVLAREADQLGEIELPRRPGRGERIDPPAEPCRIERVEAGVDLVVRELLLRCVFGLDDRLDGAELAADDAAQPIRVGGEDRGNSDRRVILAAGVEDRVKVRAGHERHVAVQHEDLGRVVGHDRQRDPHRVAGAAGLFLEREVGSIAEWGADRVDRRRVHDDGSCRRDLRGGRFGPGVQGVGEHRPATERVKDLGDARLHARAEARGKHDGRGPCGLGHGGTGRVGTWGVHARRRACAERSRRRR
jgi:hypothetical protein